MYHNPPFYLFFFFSSRRRHTRWPRDWSSDVCSSDLPESEALVIYNYSKKAGYERAWNPAVRNCRGLIVDHVTDEVKARPWPKFFNYEEPGEVTIMGWEKVAVQDKLDGSLGIIYTAPDGLPAVATRGSFTSDQALWATDFLRSKAPEWRPNPLMTYLVEIVYPDNRIVVDYGDREDLVLLDAYHTNHLEQSPDPLGKAKAYHYWPFGQADLLGFMTFNEFMANLPNFHRENAEGVVVSTRDGRRLKFKQDDYVEKHRMVTNLNPITVWRHMQDNDYRYERLLQDLPEEFQGYVQQQGDALIQTANTMIKGARMHH